MIWSAGQNPGGPEKQIISRHLWRQGEDSTALLCYARHFADKGPYSQSYGFSSSHVRIWELAHKEDWVPRNWCFHTVLLEKTLQSPLDSKEIKPINPKRNQPWIFIGRTAAEASALILGPPHKRWLIGKDPDAGKDWRHVYIYIYTHICIYMCICICISFGEQKFLILTKFNL